MREGPAPPPAILYRLAFTDQLKLSQGRVMQGALAPWGSGAGLDILRVTGSGARPADGGPVLGISTTFSRLAREGRYRPGRTTLAGPHTTE